MNETSSPASAAATGGLGQAGGAPCPWVGVALAGGLADNTITQLAPSISLGDLALTRWSRRPQAVLIQWILLPTLHLLDRVRSFSDFQIALTSSARVMGSNGFGITPRAPIAR
jgi:hypothetical protein